MSVEAGRRLYGYYIRAILKEFVCNSCSVVTLMRLRIPRESFLVFTTSSKLYVFRGVLGAAFGGGVVDGFNISLSGGFGAGD